MNSWLVFYLLAFLGLQLAALSITTSHDMADKERRIADLERDVKFLQSHVSVLGSSLVTIKTGEHAK